MMNRLSQLFLLLFVSTAMATSSTFAQTTIGILGDSKGEFGFLHSPNSTPIYPELSDSIYKIQFELSGPVKAVSLTVGRDYEDRGFPWERSRIRFNPQGIIEFIEPLGGWESFSFEYKGSLLSNRKEYDRNGVLARQINYEYAKNTGLVSKEIHYEITDGKSELDSITKRVFKDSNPGGKCYFFKDDSYDVEKDETYSSNYFHYFTCLKTQRFGDEVSLVRGRNKISFYRNGTLSLDNGSWLLHVYLDDNNFIRKIVEYNKRQHSNFSTYNVTEYEDLQLDQYGNWLIRKTHKTEYKLGEQTAYRNFTVERTITYY